MSSDEYLARFAVVVSMMADQIANKFIAGKPNKAAAQAIELFYLAANVHEQLGDFDLSLWEDEEQKRDWYKPARNKNKCKSSCICTRRHRRMMKFRSS
jgi:hypothetical protein